MPGERTGFPEAGPYHDFCHLLGDYSTEPEGEVQVASFTAGFKRERPFYVMLFALLIFSTGVNMRPTRDGYVTKGVLGMPVVAEKMFDAIELGRPAPQRRRRRSRRWRRENRVPCGQPAVQRAGYRLKTK